VGANRSLKVAVLGAVFGPPLYIHKTKRGLELELDPEPWLPGVSLYVASRRTTSVMQFSTVSRLLCAYMANMGFVLLLPGGWTSVMFLSFQHFEVTHYFMTH
jgi:hypothetical protein